MSEYHVEQPEISEPPRPITTAELLRKLPDHVTGQDLKNERKRGFLPDLEDGIKEVCIKGLDRAQAMSLNGVKRYANTDENLTFSLDDVAVHQHKALVSKSPDTTMNPTSTETMAFVIGLLQNGVPLEGGSARRLMVPLLKASVPSITEEQANGYASMFDGLAGFFDLRADRQLERLQNASPELVERGRLSVLARVRAIREMTKNVGGEESLGHRNPLTGFGYAPEMRAIDFSQGNVKLSSSLLFAGFVGNTMAIEIAEREFCDSWEPLIPMLAQMMMPPRRA